MFYRFYWTTNSRDWFHWRFDSLSSRCPPCWQPLLFGPFLSPPGHWNIWNTMKNMWSFYGYCEWSSCHWIQSLIFCVFIWRLIMWPHIMTQCVVLCIHSVTGYLRMSSNGRLCGLFRRRNRPPETIGLLFCSLSDTLFERHVWIRIDLYSVNAVTWYLWWSSFFCLFSWCKLIVIQWVHVLWTVYSLHFIIVSLLQSCVVTCGHVSC